MSGGSINVRGSTTEDIALGDIYKPTNFNFSGAKGEYMTSLLKKFQKEQKGDSKLKEFIEDLDYYNNKRNDDVLGLEEKLKAGSREDLIWAATDYKDRFQRLLFRYQFSDAAQRILLHLLAEVQSRFINEIYPMLCKKESMDKINLLITERLINPVKDELGENYLGITVQHINGMLYFLTGNCHIKWNK